MRLIMEATCGRDVCQAMPLALDQSQSALEAEDPRQRLWRHAEFGVEPLPEVLPAPPYLVASWRTETRPCVCASLLHAQASSGRERTGRSAFRNT